MGSCLTQLLAYAAYFRAVFHETNRVAGLPSRWTLPSRDAVCDEGAVRRIRYPTYERDHPILV